MRIDVDQSEKSKLLLGGIKEEKLLFYPKSEEDLACRERISNIKEQKIGSRPSIALFDANEFADPTYKK